MDSNHLTVPFADATADSDDHQSSSGDAVLEEEEESSMIPSTEDDDNELDTNDSDNDIDDEDMIPLDDDNDADVSDSPDQTKEKREKKDKLSPLHNRHQVVFRATTSKDDSSKSLNLPASLERDPSSSVGSSEGQRATRRRSSVIRKSVVQDLETGKEGGRGALATIRSERSSEPRSRTDRFKREMQKFWNRTSPRPEECSSQELNTSQHSGRSGRFSLHERLKANAKIKIDEHVEDEEADVHPVEPTRQYRLKSVAGNGNEDQSWLGKCIGLGGGGITIYDDDAEGKSCTFCGISPNAFVILYLHWAFRKTFSTVFLSASFVFITLTILFAIPIYAIGRRHPTCIGGVLPDDDTYGGPVGGSFIDAWELSWTTFTTVGYGLVYSGISSTEPDVRKCTGITIIVTVEAFIGVLFASMCGAIMFSKVARIQSYAQVTFSDPLVIRYGSGVAIEEDVQDLNAEESSASEEERERIPCPVLEFRINNRLHSIGGGEIIDATLNLVASIDADQASSMLRKATTRNVRRRKKKKAVRRRQQMNGNKLLGSPKKSSTMQKMPSQRTLIRELTKSSRKASNESLPSSISENGANGRYKYQAFEEDPTGTLVAKKIFSKLEIESPDHPFFKRVWTVRHVLDEHSPLLRTAARQLIRQNQGFWPKQLNNHEGVRASILFDQMLVSLSGTSNADANSVYAQKIYEFSDVNVGYSFVNQLYRDRDDGALRVDTSLINDVMEQAGGGGEPLSADSSGNHLTDMWVL